jgi:predicted ArsR family transcriptional regulator
MPDTPPPRTVVAGAALAALAVPTRFALLSHLLAAGPQTASQCAAVVGQSPSNCSWHLRALAEVGLVEPAPQDDGDGRTRPWRAAAVGFDFSAEPGPAAAIARAALTEMSAQHADDLHRRYLARQDLLPAEWTAASGTNGYALELTADELRELTAAVDALVRPYVRAIRADPPPRSGVVHATWRAFLHPDLVPDDSQP